MGRLYRSKKRKAAHWILGILVDKQSLEQTKENNEEIYKKVYSFTTINDLAKISKKFKINIIRDASHFLYTNNHIDVLSNDKNYNEVKIKANIKGEYAYRDSYYLMENRRDRNETIDSYAKWLIPLISLVVSIIALYFSTSDK